MSARTMRLVTKILVTGFFGIAISSVNISPANAFAGKLENGNLAYAQSEFNKGEACNYLPGFEKGYDAWHFVLTTRGATFQQDPKNPAVSINLNFVFMRQDGSLFVIKSGAWVQTGKGAYTYTPVADRIRMVQAGSVALINGSDSGIRLSHTCPGTGSITATPTTSPTSTATASPTPTVSPTATTSPRPTVSPTPTTSPTATVAPSPTSSPTASPRPTTTASPTPTASASPTVSPSPSLSPSPTPTPSSTVIPKLAPRPSARASAIQVRPTSTPNQLPTPKPSPQGIESSPTPSPSPTRTSSPSPTPTQTSSPAPTPTGTTNPTGTPTPTSSPEPTSSPTPTTSPTATPRPTVLIPPVLPVPPVVEEPKNLVFVEPKTPTVVPPQSLPEPPASPVIISKQPEYGTATITPAGALTYTSNLVNPKSTTVDVVEITYTSLSGAVVVVRKEFVLAQRGDVPSIIQTGYPGLIDPNYLWFGLFALVVLTIAFRKRGDHNEA